MQRNGRNRRTRRSGFTLLEILIVVAIIALLAAFVVPSFMGTQTDAQKKLAQSAVAPGGTLGMQLDIFRTHMGRYPKELKELIEKPDDDDEASKWAGPYIQDANALKDPWGQELQYRFPGEFKDESTYDLWSKGPDMQDGTDDDITNWPKK